LVASVHSHPTYTPDPIYGYDWNTFYINEHGRSIEMNIIDRYAFETVRVTKLPKNARQADDYTIIWEGIPE
jgi:hypothetical protein